MAEGVKRKGSLSNPVRVGSSYAGGEEEVEAGAPFSLGEEKWHDDFPDPVMEDQPVYAVDARRISSFCPFVEVLICLQQVFFVHLAGVLSAAQDHVINKGIDPLVRDRRVKLQLAGVGAGFGDAVCLALFSVDEPRGPHKAPGTEAHQGA